MMLDFRSFGLQKFLLSNMYEISGIVHTNQ